ncbi:hypothetical protein CQ018_13995 [Arthrobacter sp. MYb227]|nr:hypothetical protein CQ018_13995 [Arthrobacter sp. MYb227]
MPVAQREENVTGGGFELDIVAREELVQEAIEALLKGPGVFISGQPGAGKRTLVTTIMRQLHGRALIIDLGFPGSNSAALAFSKILDDCVTQDASTRFMALGTVHALLQDESMGLPIIVFVPEHFKLVPEAVAMLASLSLATALSLLCTGTITPSTGHQVHDELTAAVHLHRIQLHPLDLKATQRVLSLHLGSAVSRRAAHQLWIASGGQIQVLRGLIQDWQERNYLLHKSDSWVVGGEAGPIGIRSRHLVTSVLDALNEAEREVLEVLAMATEIPLNVLMTLCDAEAVDAVFARGLIESRGKYSRTVRVISTYHSRVAMEMTPPGRARSLLEKFRSLTNSGYTLPSLTQMVWEQSSGIRPTQELVDAAAKEALANGQLQLCLELLGNAEKSGPEIELIYLEALLRAGYLERAKDSVRVLRLSLGSRHSEEFGGLNTDEVASIFRLDFIEVLMLSRQPATVWETLETKLDDVRRDYEKWSKEHSERTPVLTELAGHLDLLEAEICHRYGELPRREKPYNHPQLAGEELLRWQFLHNRQSIRSGKTRLGLKRGRELVMLLQQERLSKTASQQVKQELADLYLISGEWQEALGVLNSAWVGGEESPRLTEIDGLYSAVAQLFEADPVAAMELLSVEIEQLRLYDPYGHLTLAAAAAALAAARLKTPDAGQLLAQFESLDISTDWEISQGATILHAGTKFELGRKEEALEQLRQAAEINAERGIVNLELSIRLMMARFGDTEGSAKLYACAQRCDSSIAEKVLANIGGSTKTNGERPSQHIADNWSMEHRNQSVQGYSTAELIDTHALGSHKITSHTARQEIPEQDSQQPSSAALALFSSLTARQQRIVAEAATGASSREISARLHIRVRTVEGHLYQIYQRVNVGNRAELLQLYLDARAAMQRPETTLRGGT